MILFLELLARKKLFFLGLASGLLLAFIFFALGAYLMLEQGITVEFNADQLAKTVSQQVETQAKLQLPEFIEQAKSELPKTMAKEATREFAKGNIQFLNVNISLPQAALQRIEKQLETNFRDSLNSSLNKINIEGMAKAVGKTSYKLTKESLEKQLNGKTFNVRTYKWVTIPVTVEIN